MGRTDHPQFLPKAEPNISEVNKTEQGADEGQMDKTLMDCVQEGCGQ